MRLVCTVLLAVAMAHNAYALEEDSIAYSLNLPETVVLADGMTFEEYLVKQVLANAKPLKERVVYESPHPCRPCRLSALGPRTSGRGGAGRTVVVRTTNPPVPRRR